MEPQRQLPSGAASGIIMQQLLMNLLRLAKGQATLQQEDLNNEQALMDMSSKKVYLLLDVSGWGEFEKLERTHGEFRYKEGEYKFWDEANFKKFHHVDGNPSASRALVLELLGKNVGAYNFRTTKTPIYMRFEGTIDEGLAASNGRKPTPLKEILTPLKFWNNHNINTTVDNIDANFCDPYWKFALHVINCAPHMLKKGYVFTAEQKYGKKVVVRISWARMLVLMFIPRNELLSLFNEVGIVRSDGGSWYPNAIKQLKNDIYKIVDGKQKGEVEHGFYGLCQELHRIRSEYNEDRDAMEIEGQQAYVY